MPVVIASKSSGPVYTVRFTLAGWAPFQQDGVELAGSGTATINAQLTIGGVTEAITVTAPNPVVDIHAARNEAILSGEVVKSIPITRTYNALIGLIPGVLTSVNDVVTSTVTTSFPIHGGRTNEGRLLLDGLAVGSPPAGNSATSYVVDVGEAQEVAFSAGGLGEVETAGLVMNVCPKRAGMRRTDRYLALGPASNFSRTT